MKRDLEHEQRVTLEIEGWLSDRKIKLKDLHKFWSEKLRVDVAQKDQELAVRWTELGNYACVQIVSSSFQELTSSREVDQKRKEDAMERLAEARLFVEVETEKRRKKREAQERADLEVR